MLAWAISVGVLVVLWVVIAWLKNPQTAIGIVPLLSILWPTWCSVEVFGLPFNVREVIVIVTLLLYCVFPKATFPIRLLWIDYAMLGIIIVQAISDTLADGFDVVTLVRSYGEFGMPYVAGRLAFSKEADLRLLCRVAIVVAVLIATVGLFEAFSGTLFKVSEGIRLWEIPFGEKPFENFNRESQRWTLLRAWGPTLHPIYFGCVQLMLMSFVLFGLIQTAKGRWAGFWAIAFPLVCLGIFSTLSRGPILAIGVLILAMLGICFRKARMPLIALAIATVFACVLFWSTVSEYLIDSTNANSGRATATETTIDGSEARITSATTRIYIFKMYRYALSQAGFFGYGTRSLEQFPPDVPITSEGREAQKFMPFVDNTYLWFTLRFGYLGGSFLVAVIILAVIRLVKAPDDNGVIAFLPASLASGLIATALVIMTVWLARDYGFWLFWLLGTASATQWDSSFEESE